MYIYTIYIYICAIILKQYRVWQFQQYSHLCKPFLTFYLLQDKYSSKKNPQALAGWWNSPSTRLESANPPVKKM